MDRLDNEGLENLYLQYFNLEFSSQPTQFIREMSNHLSCVTVGEKKVNIITLKGQGAAVYPSVKNGYGVTTPMIYPLTHELQFPHILTQSILIEDTAKNLKSLDNERKLNNSLHFLSTQDNQLKSEEIEAFTADVRANNKRLVSLHLSVLIFEMNDKTRKAHIERTISAFRSINGCETLIESLDTAALYFASAPGNGYQVPDRWLLMPADYGSCYLNFTTTYQGDKKGDILCDRFRNPLLVNLFNTSLNNQNCLTIGPSGSGKSYTMGNFMTQRFERNARQIIIDVGGTYKNLMESLVGIQCYFEYDMEHPLSFNPFLLEKRNDEYLLTSDKVNFLTALLSTIWKGTETAIPFKLVCFDMAKVKSDPSLYPVVSMLITELALDQVRKFPSDQKYIYMDEAWSMLSDSMGDWVESMYRTIRKNNGSMCIITQGIDEIIESGVGAAIIANAQTQIILNHTDKNQVAKVAKHLGFTDHEVDKINSIRKGKGYRELFIKQGDVGKIYCLEVCPHLDAVLSSKPQERNYLRELTKRYSGNIHFAVDQYIEDKSMSNSVFSQAVEKKGVAIE
jgi:type IV secretory pathway VirB4 component